MPSNFASFFCPATMDPARPPAMSLVQFNDIVTATLDNSSDNASSSAARLPNPHPQNLAQNGVRAMFSKFKQRATAIVHRGDGRGKSGHPRAKSPEYRIPELRFSLSFASFGSGSLSRVEPTAAPAAYAPHIEHTAPRAGHIDSGPPTPPKSSPLAAGSAPASSTSLSAAAHGPSSLPSTSALSSSSPSPSRDFTPKATSIRRENWVHAPAPVAQRPATAPTMTSAPPSSFPLAARRAGFARPATSGAMTTMASSPTLVEHRHEGGAGSTRGRCMCRCRWDGSEEHHSHSAEGGDGKQEDEKFSSSMAFSLPTPSNHLRPPLKLAFPEAEDVFSSISDNSLRRSPSLSTTPQNSSRPSTASSATYEPATPKASKHDSSSSSASSSSNSTSPSSTLSSPPTTPGSSPTRTRPRRPTLPPSLRIGVVLPPAKPAPVGPIPPPPTSPSGSGPPPKCPLPALPIPEYVVSFENDSPILPSAFASSIDEPETPTPTRSANRARAASVALSVISLAPSLLDAFPVPPVHIPRHGDADADGLAACVRGHSASNSLGSDGEEYHSACSGGGRAA
ncbi:hypothetical protein MKEN_00419600 [Mycena kentingensis (nom. inval.)]|nr:hypothetical protein MKEN_00419600 [Mycena kentingensis (nom. inval.)]